MSNEELVYRIRSGIDPAENMLQLWEQTKDFISFIARKYKGLAELEDLEQEGYLALYDAVDGYDRKYGTVFITFASMLIKQRMSKYIKNNCSTAHITAHALSKVQQYTELVAELTEKLGRKPSKAEIQKYAGLSDEYVDKVEMTIGIMCIDSLDRQIETDEGDGGTIGNAVAADVDVETSVLDKVDQEILQSVIWPLVDALPGEQGLVLRARYQDSRTLKDIGSQLGVCYQYVRDLERNGLRGLRRSRNAAKLRSFLPEAEEIYSRGLRGNSAGRFATTWTSSTERVALGLILK